MRCGALMMSCASVDDEEGLKEMIDHELYKREVDERSKVQVY